MTDRYPPIHPKCPHFLHGGDYNPDQWPPEIWDEDMRLMKLCHCNAMSVGIFSWAHLEVAEGEFRFDWLDRVMDLLTDHDAFAVLATPSASHPAWLSAKHAQVLRVDADGRRRRHGNRVNYCLTSPVLREKCAIVSEKLAERYKDHPALLMWHISNEYGGDCHCELCEGAFRKWLQQRYDTLDALNAAWWTAFWGHTYGDWEQITSPGGLGESSMPAMRLDWMRFVTDQTASFMTNEITPLRRLSPDVPVTTNGMGTYTGLDYWRLADLQDRVSWDNYPMYHDRDDDWLAAAHVSFVHDIYRAMKGGKPFLLMESSPSSANWMPVMKLKRPGVHRLSSLQAVAHGADTVQYFQWRKGRGGAEKLHGAVVDHCGHENTRVFREVAEVGEILRKIEPVLGTTVRPEVAVVYDWENRWAIDFCAGPRHERRDYEPTCARHYRQFWQRAVPVDVLEMNCDFSGYKLLIAPMLYLVKPGVAERVEQFVEAGGVFVTTYWSGIVNETDLCPTDGLPGPLKNVLGIWSEELDVLHDGETNRVAFCEPNALDLNGEHTAEVFCNLVHLKSAYALATYLDDFYAGRAALTGNNYGKGKAYYIASRNAAAFLGAFYERLIERLGIRRVLSARLPEGVTAQLRTDGLREFIFLLNFQREGRYLDLGEEKFTDMLTGQDVEGQIKIDGYDSMVLERRQ